MAKAQPLPEVDLVRRKMALQTISVSLPSDLAKAAREYAEREGCTLSSVFALAVRVYLAANQ